MTDRCLVSRILCSLSIVIVLAICASSALAQEKNPKYEVGLLVTSLNVSQKSDTDTGLGLRFTHNVTDFLGLEAEWSQFLQTREGGGHNEIQAFFGVRSGIRRKRYGLYAKVRPGLTRFYLLGVTPGPNAFEQGHSRFSLDVGGVFEYYPHRNLAVRVDAGDTMINFKRGDFFYQRLDEPMFVNRQLSHNLQINVGVAFRF